MVPRGLWEASDSLKGVSRGLRAFQGYQERFFLIPSEFKRDTEKSQGRIWRFSEIF